MIISAIVTILVEATNQRIAARSDRTRWIALFVVCLGQLMIVLDTTIVNVALPSIQRDLHFSQSSLTWVIDGYLITFGSLLLLAGRLGDLFGRKRIFLIGLASFVVASMICGVAQSEAMLIGARFAPGRRRRTHLGGRRRDHLGRVSRAGRPRQGDERLHVRRCGWRLARAAAGRDPHPGDQLALDLLRQPADRRCGVLLRPEADRRERGPRRGRGHRLAGLDPGHRRIDHRDLRPDQDPRVGLDRWQDARRARRLARPAGRLRRLRVPHQKSDHAPAHPRRSQPGGLEPGSRLPGDRRLLDLLPRRALPRACAPLRRHSDRARLHGDERRARCDVRRDLGPSGGALRSQADPGRRDRERSRRAGDLLAGGRAHPTSP